MQDSAACPFCSPYADDIIAKNTLCYARWDRFPVSKGHLLIMPFRHTPDYFSLTAEEKLAMVDLIEECRTIIESNFKPQGYNIGYNIGNAAGQTVMHCHCHFSPGTGGIPIIPEVESVALSPGNTTRIPCGTAAGNEMSTQGSTIFTRSSSVWRGQTAVPSLWRDFRHVPHARITPVFWVNWFTCS